MSKFVTRHLKIIWILFVVVFVVLFAALGLRSVLEKPPTPEIVVLDAVRWNMTKTQETHTIGEIVESGYEDDNDTVWVNSVIHVGSYFVDYYSAVGADMLGFFINCSANTNLGYIQSININFSRTDSNSDVNPINDWDVLVQAKNLDVWRFDSHATSTQECHIMAKTVEQRNFAWLRIYNAWVLRKKEASHLITVTLQTTFFDGTDHIKTVMPIQLEVHTR
jgi:hypothetical protein